MNDITQYYKRNLPHIIPSNSILSITFRLKGSIPKAAMDKMRLEHEERLRKIDDLLGSTKKLAIFEEEERFFRVYDNYMDQSQRGPHYLHDAQVRNILHQHLTKFDGISHEVIAYCIMSNHVHLLIHLNNEAYNYSDIMHSIKGASAFYINRYLGQIGSLWQTESFDRYMRNEKHFNSTIAYILNNPVKAGLVENWYDHFGTFLKNWKM